MGRNAPLPYLCPGAVGHIQRDQKAEPMKTTPRWAVYFKGMTSRDLRTGFLNKLEYSIAKDEYTYVPYDLFLSLSYVIRDRLIERWIITQQKYHAVDPKRVYYLSLEFLMGRLLSNNIANLGIRDVAREAMESLGLEYGDIEDQEVDAGLGNGGLGRLAACFLDSMATLELPALGYGIRYEFGIFTQKIVNGYQREEPEDWLEKGNPWEIERPEYKQRVRFYGKLLKDEDENGNQLIKWVDTEDVVAVPYDTPVPGFGCNTVNTLRLWSARGATEIDLAHFQAGDYIGACEEKINSENISKVLYPNDSNHSGKELRLKQQAFFTSASLQDIIRRYLKHHTDFGQFARKNAIQLNDTHPAIAIVELLRLLLDEHRLAWSKAWNIVVKTFGYTNHTLMPEALEMWEVSLMKQLLPRHMDLIYKINSRFLRQISYKYPGDTDRRRRMSLIEEGGEPRVRMAFLAIVGSHSVNGVAKLHTQLLTSGLVRDFYEIWPEKFNSKTNGITQRRWLYSANRELSDLITRRIGAGWVKKLSDLRMLEDQIDDVEFRSQWRRVKLLRKEKLAVKLRKWEGIDIDVNMMFDVHIKRIHEYKRQLLNILHCVYLYKRLKAGNRDGFVPRTVFFAGKAAPGYQMAKMVIKFINSVSSVVNNDPETRDLLRVHFVPNYRVSLAEYLIPAADLSQQISAAGTEASGTGNMKFALNGALTIGTMDGANIEMLDDIGEENMFMFGLRADEIAQLKANGYNPSEFYGRSESLRGVIDLIKAEFFNPESSRLFDPIIDSLFNSDRYMVFADFDAYVACQERITGVYLDRERWTSMSITNVARMGRFSSDRTIREYADEIWHTKPVHVGLDR